MCPQMLSFRFRCENNIKECEYYLRQCFEFNLDQSLSQ